MHFSSVLFTFLFVFSTAASALVGYDSPNTVLIKDSRFELKKSELTTFLKEAYDNPSIKNVSTTWSYQTYTPLEVLFTMVGASTAYHREVKFTATKEGTDYKIACTLVVVGGENYTIDIYTQNCSSSPEAIVDSSTRRKLSDYTAVKSAKFPAAQ